MYISGDNPRSIFEIPGAKEVSSQFIIWFLALSPFFINIFIKPL
jgi:hypothetical protein